MKKVDPLPSRSSADKDLPAMGRNSAIKNFAPSAEGHQLGLLEPRRDKEPLVRSLLSTPWVFVASRLQRNADTCATKRVKERVEVTLDPVSGRVVSFTRAGRSYKVIRSCRRGRSNADGGTRAKGAPDAFGGCWPEEASGT